jgi:ABC-2 type transport system ATP-binding protein
MTVLISTHELADIENVASHVAFIDQGRLLFQESMSELSGRFREVRVTLNEPAVTLSNCASSWLQVSVVGNVLRFVETQFDASDLKAKIASLLPLANHIDVLPINLRSIFTVLARDAQHKAS